MSNGKDSDYCDMRGMLSFLILFLLSKKDMHGQEITDEIEQRKGSRPSPGTIYPALKNLKDAALIIESKEGKTITYSLTPEGKKALKVAKEKFCRTFTGVY
jgi:PadR family transcriptional regulator, regulatory protein PadR